MTIHIIVTLSVAPLPAFRYIMHQRMLIDRPSVRNTGLRDRVFSDMNGRNRSRSRVEE